MKSKGKGFGFLKKRNLFKINLVNNVPILRPKPTFTIKNKQVSSKNNGISLKVAQKNKISEY